MKLVAPSMEKAVIRLITSADQEVSHYALAKLRSEHFGYPATLEAYERCAFIAKKHNEVMSWDELIADGAMSDSSKEVLTAYKKRPSDISKARINKYISSLDHYRKMRVVFHSASDALLKLKADKVDIDQVIDHQYDGLSKAKSSSQTVATVINYGEKNNSSFLIKNLLEGKPKPFLPTGIKAFDDVNLGWFFKSLVLLSASSSGGKSAVALNIAKYQAKYGAKVCFVPLEMDEEEVNLRLMANECEIDMSKMINPKLLTDEDKKKLKRKYAAFVNGLKKKKSRLTVWKPTSDMTFDDIMFHLKPMGYHIIYIDYINLLAGLDGDQQWRVLGEIARAAKIYASNNNCIIVLLTQLNEDMSVRYSKAVNEHANNNWKWLRDQKAKDTHILNITQGKARNQRDHPFSLLEEFQFMRVSDVPEGYTPEVSQQQVKSNKINRTKNIDDGDYFSKKAAA